MKIENSVIIKKSIDGYTGVLYNDYARREKSIAYPSST